MRKKLTTLLTILTIICLAVSFITLAPTQSVFGETLSTDVSHMWDYDAEELQFFENYAQTQKGFDDQKSGLLVKSVKSGNDAEGVEFTYKDIVSDTFEMDFRVFSEKSYTPKDKDKTYTHSVGWAAGLDTRMDLYKNDEFNPYLDLKEVGITFRSTVNTNAWFTVFVRGGWALGRADWATARVMASTDDMSSPYSLKGYGLIGGISWPNPDWTIDQTHGVGFTELATTFSGAVISGKSVPMSISFDPETMTVKGNNSSGMVTVRNMLTNEGLNASHGSYFGSLKAEDFQSGYTVSVQFTDMTDNSTVASELPDSDAGYNECLTAQYQTFDTAYERFAQMIIYSVNGITFQQAETSVSQVGQAIVKDGVALDADKFNGENRALLLTSAKSGDEAEGAQFSINHDFSGNKAFEIDFRVFSEKSYVGADGLHYTHSTNSWDTTHPSQSATLYATDAFNPYMDLREVAFTFTSKTNAKAWFTVYVRGGYGGGRADLSSARVYTSTDAGDSMGFTDSLEGKILYGYGLEGNDGWPSPSWEASNGSRYSMLGGSFSNSVVNGTSVSNMIRFNPETMQVLGHNGSSFELVRDLTSNAKVASAYQGRFGTLSADDFSGGYTVSVEFTDVTANDVVAGDLSAVKTWGDFGYGDLNAQYKQFNTAYDRYANMLVYGVKEGETNLINNNGLIGDLVPEPTVYVHIEKEGFVVGQEIDITPSVYAGKTPLSYTGEVRWENTTDSTAGKITATDGKYLFVPETDGVYVFGYSAMEYSEYGKTQAFVYAVKTQIHYCLSIKDANGDLLASYNVKDGESVVLTAEEIAGKQFVGFEYRNKLLANGSEVTVSKDETITAYYLQLTLSSEAYIRTKKTDAQKYGMLFEVETDGVLGILIEKGYTRCAYGFILPTDMVDDDFKPTSNGLNLKLTFENGKARFGITNIKETNYERKFSYLAYVNVLYSDGSVQTVTSSYDAAVNAFSVKEVAEDLLEDYNAGTQFTAEELEVYKMYAGK